MSAYNASAPIVVVIVETTSQFTFSTSMRHNMVLNDIIEAISMLFPTRKTYKNLQT